MGVSFHVGVLPNRPAAEVAEFAAQAEELGFEGIWVADSQSVFRDAFVTLTLCATRTERVRLATGVTNPVTRHPAVLAGSFATIDELSGGRAVIGIGVGESAVQTLGLGQARLARLEEATHVLRGLLSGDEVVFDGARLQMRWPARRIPIFLASSGPRSLRLAGRVADGVLFQVGADPALVRYALRSIAAGAEEAGRDPGSITRYLRLACSVGADRERVREAAKGYAAVAAGTVFANVPREHLPPDVWEDIRQMKERYDYYEHGSATASHAELLTDRALDAIAIAGTPEEALPRFRELISLGVDGFVLPIATPDPLETLRVLTDDVITRL
jgi:5,10-methylenetetrahydromethanopterin reductase